jgi:hypothetical protein
MRLRARFSILFLLVLTMVVAVVVQYAYWTRVSRSPIKWIPYSETAKAKALESGKIVAVWLKPDFTANSNYSEQFIDTPQIRLAFCKNNVLPLVLNYSDHRETEPSRVIKEVGGHPFYPSLGIYGPNRTIVSFKNLMNGAVSEEIARSLKEIRDLSNER